MTSSTHRIVGVEDRQRVFVESSLYEEFSLDGIEDQNLADFFFADGTVDAFCLQCGRPSTFHISEPSRGSTDARPKPPLQGVTTITAHCGRGGKASYRGCQGIFSVSIYREHDLLMKVGQFPSRKVCDFGMLDPVFNRELDRLLRDELGAAVGLRAHGIGIGSYVYLRRIIEVLVDEAHEEAQKLPKWDEEAYRRQSRVVEKIKLLQAVLPSTLVGSAEAYAILSKGLHELSEDECKAHFDLVFQAIQMILRRRAERKEQERLAVELGKRKSNMGTARGPGEAEE